MGARPAYFDYAATTPADHRVLDEMLPHFGPDGAFGNPSSVQHRHGTAAAEMVESARRRVALAVGARPAEIVWTSGATEADNLAIRGALRAPARRTRRLVTVSTEHLAVLDTARAMRKEGFAVDVLPVNRMGMVDLDRLRSLVRAAPALVSVMWVNNETGVVQPIGQIAEICKAAGALLHVDAAQAAGKVDISIKRIPVDLMSLSAHKVYGPKGIGALVVRRGTALQPLASGGGQERGLRPGTVPAPLAVGMGKAFEIQAKERDRLAKSASTWHDRVAGLVESLGDARINGERAGKVPHILSASFGGIGRDLLAALPGVALSSSSACTTEKVATSHVLTGMGLTKSQALASLRVSFGRFTTDAEVDLLAGEISRAIPALRGAGR